MCCGRLMRLLQLTCMVKVQTTISPRRKRSALLASARSEALEDARGYSPVQHAMIYQTEHSTPAQVHFVH